MLQLLAVTCYLPNASFVYNPITHMGQLRATYIPEDDSNAYQICSKLNERLARASIELANEEEAISANFEYRHGFNVEIGIEFKTEEEQAAGILTSQSNFKISMLDMDAEVKQTLAYFSVQSYNANDCLLNVDNYLVGNRMIVTADQAGCNYDITMFGQKVAGLTEEELNQTVIATINCFEMSVSIPVGINFSTLSPSDQFQIRFDCDAQENSTDCLNIIKNFTFEPMTTSNFELKFQLSDPDTEYLHLQSKFSDIVDPDFLECYSEVEYQINGEIVIFYFTPTGNCEFNTMDNEMIIAISDSKNLRIAKMWVFIQYNFTFDSSTVKFSLECNQLDIEDCSDLLTYLAQLEDIFVSLTFVIYQNNDIYFIVTTPTRYQQCFEFVEMTTSYKHGAEYGAIHIKNIVLGLPGCTLMNPNRVLIQLQCYRKTVPNGMITEIESSPFLTLVQRQIFSVDNITVTFDDIFNITLLAELASLTETGSIYCAMQYDDILLPIIKYTDLTSIYDNNRIYLISVIGGIVGGLMVAGVEVFMVIKCEENPQKAKKTRKVRKQKMRK